MGVVLSILSIESKLRYLEMTCMFLGYAQNIMDGTYDMLKLCTKHIVLSHDIIWLNKTYGEYVPRL